ncbi:MAG: phage integrase N-terminal SAM-like domain-containing protein [Muribaculaceae bacterium]|nr:phage integrase N-terminal SAM-like domain-containing protein [Muribaculaceae bacterium]
MATSTLFDPRNTGLRIESDRVSNIDSDIVFRDTNLYNIDNEDINLKSDFVQNYSTIDSLPVLNEGIRLKFYVPNYNKRGWGVVYLRYRIGDKVSRISTRLKVKKDCWNKDKINFNAITNSLDYTIHFEVNKNLLTLFNYCQKFFLCNFAALANQQDNIIKLFKNNIMMKNKNCKQMLSLSLKQTAERHSDKDTTLRTYWSKVDVLKRFMAIYEIEDDVRSMTQENLKKFRDYLCETNSASTARTTLGVIKFLLVTAQRDDDNIKFDIDFSLLAPIKEKRSREDKKENGIALTHSEIEKLKLLTDLNAKQKKYRDLFVIQCQSGIRLEDFPLLLDSSNHEDKGQVTYATFKTTKKGVHANIPLNAPNFYSDTLEMMRPYIDGEITKFNYEDTTKLRRNINNNIRTLAKMVGLDRKITKTQTINNRIVSKTIKVCDNISSHDARRTFITNCIREFGLDPSDIKGMSAHSGTKMIEEVYSILTKEDKLNEVAKTIESMDKPKGVVPSVNIPVSASKGNNYLVDGVEEGLSILKFLGAETAKENPTFEEVIAMIERKQNTLMEEYGVKVDTLKTLFNIEVPLKNRVKAVRELYSIAQ